MKFLKFILLSAIVSSCSVTQIASTWKSDQRQKPKAILVIALLPSADKAFSDNIENYVTGDLLCLGYDAYSLHDFNSRLIVTDNQAATIANLKGKSIDAVITITLLDWKREKKAMPEALWRSPYNHYNCELLCYVDALQPKLSVPFDSRKRYTWESNMYYTSDLKLRYAIRMRPGILKDARNRAYDCFDKIVSDMIWQGLLDNPED